MGVQLSEATKAARELGPEARAQLSNVVKREDLLIMLQDKADNSVMSKLSDQATQSVRTIEQLGEQVSNLLRQHAHSLITLSAERENGDAALSSRLDKIQSTLMSLRVPSRQETKGPPIKLPSSNIPSSATATAVPAAKVANAAVTEHTPSLPDSSYSKPEATANVEPKLQNDALTADTPALTPEYLSSKQTDNSPLDPDCMPKAPQGGNPVIDAPPPDVEIPTGRTVNATTTAEVELLPALTSYLQPGTCLPGTVHSQIEHSFDSDLNRDTIPGRNRPLYKVPVSDKVSQAQSGNGESSSIRCLSCDAPTSSSLQPMLPPSRRVMGGGFKIDNILGGSRGCAPVQGIPPDPPFS